MCKYEYNDVYNNIEIEEWENGEYIVKYNGNELGMTVTREKAEFLKRWLPSAFMELSLLIVNNTTGC